MMHYFYAISFAMLTLMVASIPSAMAKPIEILTASGVTHHFDVQTAVTIEERSQGLMWVDKLEDGRGMLFAFPQARIVAFWMKNTLIQLDILYLLEDGTIVKMYEQTKPEDLKLLPSRKQVKYALEIAGGTAKKLGIAEGDKVILKDCLKGLEIK